MDQVVVATEPGTLVAGTAGFTPSDANTPRLVPPIVMAKLKGDRTQTSDCSLDSVDTVAAGSRSDKDVETSGVPIEPPANYGDRRDTVTTLVDLPEEDVAEELVVADVAQQIEDGSPPVNKAQVAIATEEEATVLKAETAAEVIALKDKRQVVEVITATPSKLDWNQLLPEETARGFFQRTRAELSKEQLRELLGKVGPFWHDFRHVYMESFNFRRLPLDYAIRLLGRACTMPREAQQIDRMIMAFAERYQQCNPQVFGAAESVYVITFAIFMLNTGLHNRNLPQSQRTTREQFIKPLLAADASGHDINRNVLLAMFESVRKHPIMGVDSMSSGNDLLLDQDDVDVNSGENINETTALDNQSCFYDFEYFMDAGEGLDELNFGLEFNTEGTQRVLDVVLGVGQKESDVAKSGDKGKLFRGAFSSSKWRRLFSRFGMTLAGLEAWNAVADADENPVTSSRKQRPSTAGASTTASQVSKTSFAGSRFGDDESLFAASLLISAEIASTRSAGNANLTMRGTAAARPTTAAVADGRSRPPMMKPAVNTNKPPLKFNMPSGGFKRSSGSTAGGGGMRRSMSMTYQSGLAAAGIGMNNPAATASAPRSKSIPHALVAKTQMKPRLAIGDIFSEPAVLQKVDLRALVDPASSPFGSSTTLLGTLYAAMQKNPLVERRLAPLSQTFNLLVNSKVSPSTVNLHPVVNPTASKYGDMMDVLFSADGIVSKLLGNVVILHHGPLMRKNIFTESSFQKPMLRSWREGWFCVVVNPGKGERAGNDTELWAFSRDELEHLLQWVDRVQVAWEKKNPEGLLLQVPLNRWPARGTADIRSVMSSMSRRQHSTMEEHTIDVHLSPIDILDSIGERFPVPKKRVRLENAIAFIDHSYEKREGTFKLAFSGSTMTAVSTTPADIRVVPGKQVLFLSGDIQRQRAATPQLDCESPAAIDKSTFLQQLMGGIGLRQKVEFLGESTADLGGADFATDDRHCWMFHVNTAAAVSTALSDMGKFLGGKDVNGQWMAVSEHVRRLAQNNLESVQNNVRQRNHELNDTKKLHCERGTFQHIAFTEEELAVLNAEIEEHLSWTEVKIVVEKAGVDALIRNLVSNVCDVEAAASKDAEDDGTGVSDVTAVHLVNLLLKLQLYRYRETQREASEAITVATRNINQLELGMISAKSAALDKDEVDASGIAQSSSHCEERTPLRPSSTLAMYSTMRLQKDFDKIVLDPGASLRRGLSMRADAKQARPRRASVKQLFFGSAVTDSQPAVTALTVKKKSLTQRRTVQSASSGRTGATTLPALPEADEQEDPFRTVDATNSSDESDGGAQYPDPGDDAVEPSSMRTRTRTSSLMGTTLNKLLAPFTARPAHHIEQELSRLERRVEALRIEHEKCRVYAAVLARVIMVLGSGVRSLEQSEVQEDNGADDDASVKAMK